MIDPDNQTPPGYMRAETARDDVGLVIDIVREELLTARDNLKDDDLKEAFDREIERAIDKVRKQADLKIEQMTLVTRFGNS